MGEFEIVGDRDLMTLWWGSGPDGFALCLPDTGENGFWSTSLKRSEFPPFLPEQVDVICHLGTESEMHCITSLADEMMIDCSDDLDFDASSGWLDAKTGTPYSGRCVTYHDNGELLERAEFIQGARVGPWTGYTESGLRDHQSFWIDGQRRRETRWHANGQMSRQTHYRSRANGEGLPVRHGLDTVWTEGGSIDSQHCWIDGLEQDVPAEKCYFD